MGKAVDKVTQDVGTDDEFDLADASEADILRQENKELKERVARLKIQAGRVPVLESLVNDLVMANANQLDIGRRIGRTMEEGRWINGYNDFY